MDTRSPTDISVALVGLGHVAKHQIAAMEMTDGIRLVAACDTNPDAAHHLVEDTPFYPSLEDLLSSCKCDFVMISAPNREHFRLGEAVIKAGRNLILEKPGVETLPQLRRIVLASQSSNIFLHFALHAAFGAEVIWLRQELALGHLDLGSLNGFRACFYDPYVTDTGLTHGADSLGGSWMDSGINALSVLGSFMDPGRLCVQTSRMRRPAGLRCSETEALVSLRSERAQGCIHTSWLTGRNHKSTLLKFDEGDILLDHSGQKVSFDDGKSRKLLFTCEGPLDRLTNHYVGVLSDLVDRFPRGNCNTDFAVTLHERFFEAADKRQWGIDDETIPNGSGI